MHTHQRRPADFCFQCGGEHPPGAFPGDLVDQEAGSGGAVVVDYAEAALLGGGSMELRYSSEVQQPPQPQSVITDRGYADDRPSSP
ncbi:hypothetical protein [Streptomyces sp. NPDC046197]|uniref:hypothetical protein n=1 Tax=Streptomyces sp. NPDC046197 TaxID=3154337 RepID=UPI003410387C